MRDLQDAGITVDAASCPVRVLDRHPSHGTPAPPLSFPTFRSTPPEDPTCSVPSLSRHPLPPIDLIITLGGDGTILHLSSLYSTAGRVPPVLSFSMGSLGFLLPFRERRSSGLPALARAFRGLTVGGTRYRPVQGNLDGRMERTLRDP